MAFRCDQRCHKWEKNTARHSHTISFKSEPSAPLHNHQTVQTLKVNSQALMKVDRVHRKLSKKNSEWWATGFFFFFLKCTLGIIGVQGFSIIWTGRYMCWFKLAILIFCLIVVNVVIICNVGLVCGCHRSSYRLLQGCAIEWIKICPSNHSYSAGWKNNFQIATLFHEVGVSIDAQSMWNVLFWFNASFMNLCGQGSNTELKMWGCHVLVPWQPVLVTLQLLL